MGIDVVTSTIFFAASAASFASAPSMPPAHPIVHGLGGTVAVLEARYPGKVVAIELDAAGDKPAHYHVDMSFPASGLARIDVDARTLGIASRETGPLPPASAALGEATALIAAAIPAPILAARLDATSGAPAHYDVDVALPQGGVAQLKVDAQTRDIAWRSPAIAVD